MPSAADQPNLGSARRLLDLVVDLVAQRSYRRARLQLSWHERRYGFSEVGELVGQITAPPPGVDPRTEAAARRHIPEVLPPWLVGPVHEEIGRICARQSIRAETVEHLLARILAASIVDESAPATDELAGFATRAHVDLRESVPVDEEQPVPDSTVVDVSRGRGSVRSDDERRPDRSLTDWLGRRA